MRNVGRKKKPETLKKNSKKWTKELLARVKVVDALKKKETALNKKAKKANKKYKKKSIPSPFDSKYNQEDVKKALGLMYNSLCCYCESKIDIVDYPHIEHREPKSKYPNKTYVWENLHLSCAKCNVKKGNDYDKANPILDAVIDNPISDHLTYKKYFRDPVSKRGKTTLKHTDLNRKELLDAREEIFIVLCQLLVDLRTADAGLANRELEKLIKGQYGTMIKHFKDKFN